MTTNSSGDLQAHRPLDAEANCRDEHTAVTFKDFSCSKGYCSDHNFGSLADQRGRFVYQTIKIEPARKCRAAGGSILKFPRLHELSKLSKTRLSNAAVCRKGIICGRECNDSGYGVSKSVSLAMAPYSSRKSLLRR